MFVDPLDILLRMTCSHPFGHLQAVGLLLLVIFVRGLHMLKLLTHSLSSVLQMQAAPRLTMV